MSRTLFIDVGGVLLTNGWDTAARNRAIANFGLDLNDFHTRHGMLKTAFETGRLSLEKYVERTVFHTPRTFSPEEFRDFMFAQSQVLGGTLDWMRSLAASGTYRLFTLNNEARELHEHRVRTFGLCSVFQAFLTSCYLGQAKPDEEIYRNAIGLAGCGGGDAIFVDDRPVNVESARMMGLTAILFEGLDQLKADFARLGVEP